MTTDYRALCAELLGALEDEASSWNLDPEEHPLVIRARAALAEPKPSTDGEVAKLPPRQPLMEPPAHPALERYDVTWDGSPDKPLLTRRADGYWTPWHIAADLLERLAPQREEVERQTPAEYNLRLADAAQAAGVGDYYWNERFLSALRNRGLELSVQRPANDHNNHYPNGAPMLAPHPYPGGAFAWPLDYLIVWSQPVPEGPSDAELLELMPQQFRDDLATVSRLAAHGTSPDVTPGIFRVSLNTGALDFARAILARWGRP